MHSTPPAGNAQNAPARRGSITPPSRARPPVTRRCLPMIDCILRAGCIVYGPSACCRLRSVRWETADETAARGYTAVMRASLRTLLAGIVDYAGLFPPAALLLDESIRNYARYLRDPDRWMLGRFICPAARLHELLAYLPKLFASGEALSISALGRG